MSHMLHRTGPAESLKNDFPILAVASRTVNRPGAAPKLIEIQRVFLRHNCVNGGVMGTKEQALDPNLPDAFFAEVTDNVTVHGLFSSEEDLIACLKELKELDLGISVVVSGLFDRVHQCCREAGLEPHSVNTSLGVWGNTDKLPKNQYSRDISTMCGHSMVPVAIIEKYADRIRKGKMTPEEAAKKLTPLCTCHVFNTQRAAELLAKMALE